LKTLVVTILRFLSCLPRKNSQRDFFQMATQMTRYSPYTISDLLQAKRTFKDFPHLFQTMTEDEMIEPGPMAGEELVTGFACEVVAQPGAKV
jgi:hypothetical protein